EELLDRHGDLTQYLDRGGRRPINLHTVVSAWVIEDVRRQSLGDVAVPCAVGRSANEQEGCRGAAKGRHGGRAVPEQWSEPHGGQRPLGCQQRRVRAKRLSDDERPTFDPRKDTAHL